MADDARICTGLAHHPKTVKVNRRLGDKGCWRLVCLFLWVAENRPDGDLVGMNSEDIEIAGEWDGEPGKFTQTLVEVRFLDGEETAYRVHDWEEHNPWVASRPQRIAKAKAAAAARWDKRNQHDRSCPSNDEDDRKHWNEGNSGKIPTPDEMCGGSKSDAQSIAQSCSEHVLAMPSSPLLSPPPKVKVKSVGAFAPPTLAQVAAYCFERGKGVDPQQWMNHYEAVGWKVGRNPMKSWKAAVRTWEGNGINGGRKDGQRTDATTQRSQQNKQTIIDAFTADSGRRDAPHGFERQDQSRLRAGEGVPIRFRQ
jgi:hypothetical protein